MQCLKGTAGVEEGYSTVPQGLVLGLILFIFFIKDVGTKCGSMQVKFADVTELGSFSNTVCVWDIIQKNQTEVTEMG